MAHPEVGQRERDLIDMLRLNDRFLEHYEDLTAVDSCDYSEARQILSRCRAQSLDFLKNSLSKAAALKSKREMSKT